MSDFEEEEDVFVGEESDFEEEDEDEEGTASEQDSLEEEDLLDDSPEELDDEVTDESYETDMEDAFSLDSSRSSAFSSKSGSYVSGSDDEDRERTWSSISGAAKRGCGYPDDDIVAEIIDEIRNDRPEKWCRLFEGVCFTNAGQLGHSNLPECTLNFDATTVTVPSMYVKDIRASNDLKLQGQTTEGTFHLSSISMSRRKFYTKPVDLTPLIEGWMATKIGNRYFMSQKTGAETGGYAFAQVVNKDHACELVVPRSLLEELCDFIIRLNWKRGYGVFEVSRVGNDWFAISRLQVLGREEGGHAVFETSEKSRSALALTGGAKRYKDEYESARELGVGGSGCMIREYEAETIREPISTKDYVPTKWPDGKFSELVDEPRLEVPGLEICRTAHPDTSAIQYEEKACTFMLPRPLHGLTFDLHSKKDNLNCIGLYKAKNGHLVDDGYRSALSTLGASFLDIVAPEYFRVGDTEMEETLKEVLCDDEKERDALALRCVKTHKRHLETKSYRPGQGLLMKAGAATRKASAVTAGAIANVAVSAAYDGGVVIDRSYRGRQVAFPVYELTPLLRLGKRWYDPNTLKQAYLMDHRIPTKLRYVDIRLKGPKKSKKERKKRPTKSKNLIKERKNPRMPASIAARDGNLKQARAVTADEERKDDTRTIVSRKTTNFADGTVKKEVIFSDGTKTAEIWETVSGSVSSTASKKKNSRKGSSSTGRRSIPAVVSPMSEQSGDDQLTALTDPSYTKSTPSSATKTGTHSSKPRKRRTAKTADSSPSASSKRSPKTKNRASSKTTASVRRSVKSSSSRDASDDEGEYVA